MDDRHTNWMDKPITWRGYMRLTAICSAIGTIVSAIYMVAWFEPAWWKATKNFVRRLCSK